MDAEERKIAALFVAYETINARVVAATQRFETVAAGLEPAVRAAVKTAVTSELAGIEAQVTRTRAALETLRRAVDWRTTLWSAVLVLLVIALTLGGFWLLTPSRAEMIEWRAERAQLHAAIEHGASEHAHLHLDAWHERPRAAVRPDRGVFTRGTDPR